MGGPEENILPQNATALCVETKHFRRARGNADSPVGIETRLRNGLPKIRGLNFLESCVMLLRNLVNLYADTNVLYGLLSSAFGVSH
jgi:hypothetical protein